MVVSGWSLEFLTDEPSLNDWITQAKDGFDKQILVKQVPQYDRRMDGSTIVIVLANGNLNMDTWIRVNVEEK